MDVDLQDDGIEIEHPQENYNGKRHDAIPSVQSSIFLFCLRPSNNPSTSEKTGDWQSNSKPKPKHSAASIKLVAYQFDISWVIFWKKILDVIRS